MTRRTWLALGAAASAHGESVPPIRGLSRTNLLEYHAADGSVRTAANAKQWEARRREVIEGMQRIMGPLPGAEKRCPLDMRVEQETDHGKYLLRSITYASEPGSRTTAFLCVPKAALAGKKAAAVLCLHPTDNRVGYGVVITGMGGRPNRQYASELAERGLVAIAPSYPHLAAYAPDLDKLGYQSGTMKAIWDNIRAVDLVESLPFVRRGALSAIGHSLGGHNAIYTAVFEPRIRCVVSSCGFDSFLDYMGGNIKGWVQNRYMMKLQDYLGKPAEVPFDFYELAGCLAPRGFFVNAPLRDSNFRHQSVARIREAATAVYRLHRAENRLHVEHPDCDHDFPDDVRQRAYAWIDKFGQGAGAK